MESNFEEILKDLLNDMVRGVSGPCLVEIVAVANTFLSTHNSKLCFDKACKKWSDTHTIGHTPPTHTRMAGDGLGTPVTHTTEARDQGSPLFQGSQSESVSDHIDSVNHTIELGSTMEGGDLGTPLPMQRRRPSPRRQLQRVSERVDFVCRYDLRKRRSPDRKKASIRKALKGHKTRKARRNINSRSGSEAAGADMPHEDSFQASGERTAEEESDQGPLRVDNQLDDETAEEEAREERAPFKESNQEHWTFDDPTDATLLDGVKAGEEAREERAPFMKSGQEPLRSDNQVGVDDPTDATLMDDETKLIGEVEKFSNNVLERLGIHERFLEILPTELSSLRFQMASEELELSLEKLNLLNGMHKLIIRSYQSITTALKILLDDKSCSDKGKEDRIRNFLNKMSDACLETKMTEEFQNMGKKFKDFYGCKEGGGGGFDGTRSKVDVTGPSSTTTSTSATKKHILDELLGPEQMKVFREMPQWEEWNSSLGNLEKFLKPIKQRDKDYIDLHCFENQLLDLKGTTLDWKSVASLRPGCELQDEIINAYVDLLQMREIELRMDKQIFYPFSTYFYNSGQSSLNRIELGLSPQVTDWAKFYWDYSQDRNGATFSGAKYAIFPVCNDKHYLLLVFDISNWHLLILEPFATDFRIFQNSASNFVTTALDHMVSKRAPGRLKDTAPDCYIPCSIAKQLNSNDCGVAVCKYLDAFTQGLNVANMRWTQAEFDNFRYRMVKELVIKKRCRTMLSKRRTEDVVSNEDGSDGAKKDEARKDGDSL